MYLEPYAYWFDLLILHTNNCLQLNSIFSLNMPSKLSEPIAWTTFIDLCG